ncbi:hypothetical protein H072_8832 [Dactylellina haptotyla CBS 200.50]|uniref:Hydrophobin n=1 Tax=Dactylellina haptotyla (strain CBS 200.50) TaxID=1284197 RepID=S8A8N4_DACHA|nr:hypothetical protein H072_8832 [Dactylellina haptotyla CBS 200.50]
MQLLTILTVGLSALSYVSAAPAPQGGFPGFRGGINNGRIGGTGPTGAGAGSAVDNNSATQGGNSGAIVNSPGSVISQTSTSCGNGGQIVCCNGPSTNTATANANSGRETTQTFPQFTSQMRNLFRSGINAPTVNNNRESNQSNQCDRITQFQTGSSDLCRNTVACCAGDFCTAFNENVVVNAPTNVNINGGRFFPKA